MNKSAILAIIINFLGIILMAVTYSTALLIKPTNPLVNPIGFIFPLIAYIITWKYFKDNFWLGFILSIALLGILIFASLFV